MTRNCFLFLLAMLIAQTVVVSKAIARQHYALFNYNSDNGLPQNSVKAATMDRDGYLWLATEMGLVRFDGKNFLFYNRENSPDLISNRIRNLGLLSNGTLYCVGGSFQVYLIKDGQVFRQDKKTAAQLIQGTDNRLYDMAPLWRDKHNRKLQSLITPLYPAQISYFMPLAAPGNKAFVFAYRKYIGFLSGGKVKWIDSVTDCRPKGFPVSFSLGAQFYYINNRKQLVAVDTSGKNTIVTIKGPLSEAWNSVTADEQINLLPQQQQQAFIHCMDGVYRLSQVNEQTLQSTLVLQDPSLSLVSTFLDLPALSLYVAGTLTQGLELFRKQFFHTVTIKDSRDLNTFYAQAVMRDGNILTHNGWIDSSHKIHPLPFLIVGKKSILKDHNGHFWISADGAICELDENARPVRKLKSPPVEGYCFYEDKDSIIWISTSVLFSRSKGFEGRIARVSHDTLIFLSPEVTGAALLRTDPEHLWVGCVDGLKEIDLTAGTLKYYPFFKDKEVRNFYKDKTGTIWIGTNGYGFFACKNKRFVHMPYDRNNYLANAHTFLEDEKGFLWISTNKGLFQMQLSDLYAYLKDSSIHPYYHYYDKADGFLTNEFNGGCTPGGIRLQDGSFSLPSLNGLVQFYPEDTRPMLPDKPIFIDEVKADTLAIPAGARLPSGFSHLNIKIASPYFGNPYNQQLEYNLKGLDNVWYPVADNNNISFNQLPKGSYVLKLRKKAGFGAGNYLSAKFPFSVAPAFTDTWLFRIGLAAAIFLLAYLFLQLRYRYVIRQKNKLQREVAYHTREQKRLIDELYFNSKMYRKISQVISHDLRSPLRFLHLISKSLPVELETGDPAETRKSISEIKTTSGQVVRFIEDFHLWVSSFNASFEPDPKIFSLSALLDELHDFFKEMLQARGNRLEIKIPAPDYLFTDQQLLKIVLRNIIDNANKYTHKGVISITMTLSGNLAFINITDSGKGINPTELHKINQRMMQAFNPTAVETDNKLGYQIIIDFVRRLNATLSVKSEEGKGTAVVIEGLKTADRSADAEA